jgi:hypothetical protein
MKPSVGYRKWRPDCWGQYSHYVVGSPTKPQPPPMWLGRETDTGGPSHAFGPLVFFLAILALLRVLGLL